jgi:hypothetical protein
VTVTLRTSEAVSPILGWTGTTGQIFTKVYSTNVSETIFFYDKVGNQGYTGITITNISTDKPVGNISYQPATATSGNVVAILQVNKELKSDTIPTGWSSSGTNTNKYTKTYTGNIVETLTLTDTAANTSTVDVNIQWIDKTSPQATSVSYNPTSTTSGTVVVTLTTNEVVNKPATRSGNATGTVFTKSYTANVTGQLVMFTDLVGNSGSTGVTISWIDTGAIVPKVTYSTTGATKDDVVATITFNKPNVMVTSSGGATHVFTENTGRTFTFVDEAGNT